MKESKRGWRGRLGIAVGGLAALVSAGCFNSGGTAPSATGQVKAVSSDTCPLQTAAQWQLFLEQSAEHEEWVHTCEDSTCDNDYNQFVKASIQGVLAQCSSFIQSHPQIASCTDRLRRFVPAWLQQHTDHSFGFTLDNAAYTAYENGSSKPKGLMDPPADIIAAIPDGDKVRSVAAAEGYQFLTHTSCLGGVRIFLYAPDAKGRFDQWILLNLKSDLKTVDTGVPMSFIGVQKQDGLGNHLSKVRLNFRDYFMEPSTGNAFKLETFADSNGKCYSCHVSGMRKLMLVDRQQFVMSASPVKGDSNYDPSSASPPDIGHQRWEQFNKKLMSYGLPDWDGTINVTDHGPALGQAQGCINCHDGVDRGFLTVETSSNQIDQKVWQELAMPPDPASALANLLLKDSLNNPPLTSDEKDQLKQGEDDHDDIESSYKDSRLPTLRSWLLENSCG